MLTLVTVKLPSSVSLAVAPISAYVPLASTVSVALPSSVITGLIVSCMITVRVAVAVLAAASVEVYVTV